MSKKSKIRCGGLIYLLSFVLVLGLVLTSVAKAADPDLVGWWKLNEGSGNTAIDSSGNGFDIPLQNSRWENGLFGGAVHFRGEGEGRLDGFNYSNNAITVCAWVWHEAFVIGNQERYVTVSSEVAVIRKESDGRLHFYIKTGGSLQHLRVSDVLRERQWHHVAGTWDGLTQRLYYDGVEIASQAPGGVLADTSGVRLSTASESINGMLDDVRIYTRALMPEEIEEVMKGIPPGLASTPSPADGATDVPRDVVLSWTPGVFVPAINGHKVYLSESFNNVNDGIGAITQSAGSYARPQRLDFNTIYYWRVDEVNNANPDSPWIGDVWSFTTEPFAYPIAGENITATASSTNQEGMEPENTINGLGLDVSDLHSTQEMTMWLSGEEKEPNRAWIEYEFDKVHKLHEMWVWNANQVMEPVLGFGLKDVTIEYSTNGTDYTTLGTTHEFVRAPGTLDYAHNTTVDFGSVAAKYVRLTANSNWGGIFKQYGLSEVRFFAIPVHAREPSPDSGTTDVDVDVTLGFRAGREAAEHNVYLSTDEQTVIDGNAPVTTVTETNYGPLSIDLGKTYYWKINEVNEAETTTTWQGDIWNFTTTDHIIVDDFEDYNDYPPDEIWSTWIDGYGVSTNGATVGYPNPDWNQDEHYVETAIVHGGSQAMPFFYSNTGGATHSEGACTFAVPQDWTKAGVQTLTLWFYGDPNNAASQMYVKVNGSKVLYDGNATNLALMSWQLWNIDLALFGVDLQSVSSLAIGIDGSGASGTLYFDDIRLYRLAPPPVSEWRITAGSDDAEEDVGGSAAFEIDLTSTDLEFMHDNNPADPLSEQVVGLRFVGIPIPKGSTITEAWVQFDADDVDDAEHVGNAYILIDGELNPDPVTFENTPNNITGRPRTTSQVQWTSEPWPADGGTHQKALTADISSIIQEIVDQDGWVGSALVLIFSQDPATPSVGHRECESFDGAGSNIDQRPTLHITYQ